ncbi:hypothetical protein NGM99_13875 [Mesorhizobium sp. RP14(2022)]|uniref:DNA 5'-3' helicase n=1 Tax=Mesorhizobium liriopis TaxID=2953882 RepID=A0ABT1C7P8_9HYPH|nr:DnaB-like helicase C-terminal domain-containing protein [Mesorhizobium liriopis]MCO6050868.1 hypothetical protein [Mesorhizobium liriopis]
MTLHAQHFNTPLPNALECEQSLLGAILHDNTQYWRVAGFLKPDHFEGGVKGVNGAIYEVLGTLIAEGRPATIQTVKSYINADQVIDPNGGDEGGPLTLFRYVVRLFSELPTLANCYEDGRGVLLAHGRRRIIRELEDGIARARNLHISDTIAKIIGDTANALTNISQEADERAASLKYGVILPKAIEQVQKASTDTASRIPWFLPEASAVMGDMRRGNLIGFMSDSGGGKTSFALSQCRHAAMCGFKSAFFSIEITEEEAALQAAAQAARVKLDRLDAFNLNTNEQRHVEDEMMKAMDLPFEIVSFSDCSLSDIAVKLEAMVKSKGLDFIAIDHAKMIQLPGKGTELFAERVNALYRGLKAIAKRLNVAIMILIQRNGDWKERWKRGGSLRPMMGDAYGGDGVKQNLDVWFSLYRPEPLYKDLIPQERRDDKRADLQVKYEDSRGKAWLINHKRRRGEPQGNQEIRFEAEYTLFTSPPTDMPDAFEGMFQ